MDVTEIYSDPEWGEGGAREMELGQRGLRQGRQIENSMIAKMDVTEI